jgi:hypothetical protein
MFRKAVKMFTIAFMLGSKPSIFSGKHLCFDAFEIFETKEHQSVTIDDL